MKRTKYSLRDLWDNIKHTNIRIIGVPEEEKKKGCEQIFEETIVENFPNMEKEKALPIREKANKQLQQQKKNSAQISPYMKLTQTTGPTLGGQKPKGRKNSNLKPGKRRPQTQ